MDGAAVDSGLSWGGTASITGGFGVATGLPVAGSFAGERVINGLWEGTMVNGLGELTGCPNPATGFTRN